MQLETGLTIVLTTQIKDAKSILICAYGSDVIVNTELGSRHSLQNDAESTRRDIEAARLKPDTIRIWNPAPLVSDVDVRSEMLATPSVGIEPVGDAAECCDWHCIRLEVSVTERKLKAHVSDSGLTRRFSGRS
jgi:hypothetical protein